jgi:hypothetical protein
MCPMETEPKTPGKLRNCKGCTIILVLVVALVAIVMMFRFSVTGLLRTPKVSVQIEIVQMGMQIEILNQNFDAYPPSNPASVVAYLQSVSPDLSAESAREEGKGLEQSTLPTPKERTKDEQERALVFWMSGISRNPKHPITGSGVRIYNYEFDNERLKSNRYYPPWKTAKQPYQYWSNGQSFKILSAGVDNEWGTDDDWSYPE